MESKSTSNRKGRRAFKSDGSPIWMNPDGTYYDLPDTRNKYFSQGRMYDIFDTVREFLESDKNMCVVPVHCIDRKNRNKRYYVDIMDSFESFRIFNVEIIDGNWVNNENNSRDIKSPRQGIEHCKVNQSYLFLLVKEPKSILGFRVKGVK